MFYLSGGFWGETGEGMAGRLSIPVLDPRTVEPPNPVSPEGGRLLESTASATRSCRSSMVSANVEKTTTLRWSPTVMPSGMARRASGAISREFLHDSAGRLRIGRLRRRPSRQRPEAHEEVEVGLYVATRGGGAVAPT